jgi:hypothetical protein
MSSHPLASLKDNSTASNPLRQTDFTDLNVIGWGWVIRA